MGHDRPGRLPVLEDATGPRPAPGAWVSAAGTVVAADDAERAGSILVVDDHEPIRFFVQTALEDEGYTVAGATNGAEALLVAEAVRPGLILLDLNMPVLDGPGFVAAYLLRPEPRASIVVMSADRDAATWVTTLGAVGYLSKPFTLAALMVMVTRHVGR